MKVSPKIVLIIFLHFLFFQNVFAQKTNDSLIFINIKDHLKLNGVVSIYSDLLMLKQKPGSNLSKAEAIEFLKTKILQKDSISHKKMMQVLSISFFVYRVNFVESKNTNKLFSYFSDNSFYEAHSVKVFDNFGGKRKFIFEFLRKQYKFVDYKIVDESCTGTNEKCMVNIKDFY
jgi:hypothetical protein